MKTINQYLAMITNQYQNSTKFLQWLTIPLMVIEDLHLCANIMPSMFDVDLAVGVQLDILGLLLGQSRILPFNPTDGTMAKLDDAIYKKILKLKTMTNYWDGSLGSIYTAWGIIFPDVNLVITDNQDMTASVSIKGELSQIVKDMIYNDLVLPRPEGVEYIYKGKIPETAAIFYYDYDDDESPYFAGYDVGYWDSSII